MPESERVKRVYQTRQEKGWEKRYPWYQGGTLQAFQERECVLLKMLERTLGDFGQQANTGYWLQKRQYPYTIFALWGQDGELLWGGHSPGSDLSSQEAIARYDICSLLRGEYTFKKGIFDLVTMFTCLSRWARKQDSDKNELLPTGSMCIIRFLSKFFCLMSLKRKAC